MKTPRELEALEAGLRRSKRPLLLLGVVCALVELPCLLFTLLLGLGVIHDRQASELAVLMCVLATLLGGASLALLWFGLRRPPLMRIVLEEPAAIRTVELQWFNGPNPVLVFWLASGHSMVSPVKLGTERPLLATVQQRIASARPG